MFEIRDTYGDPVSLSKFGVGGRERWYLDVTSSDSVPTAVATAVLTRADLHALHAHLTVELGL